MEKTKSDRLLIVNEVKLGIVNNELNNELASKILFKMLDDYCENGTTYENKELSMKSIKKKYVVNLYNNNRKRDQVLIRTM